MTRWKFLMSRGKIVSLVAAFLISAGITAAATDSYLVAGFKIARCSTSPPRPGDVMVGCWAGAQSFYYAGSVYLGVDQELIDGVKAADVVVLGNSRTLRTFRAPSIDRYFKAKGLRYFVLTSEGSGFRFSQMLLERVGARPKILLVNNESFAIDILEDTYRAFVQTPDRFYAPYVAFYEARRMQKRICDSSLVPLKWFYCNGTAGAWRSAVNGTVGLEPADPAGHVLVQVPPETRLPYKDAYMANAHAFLDSPSTRAGCLIDYIIPSNNASVDLARAMAVDLKAPFVYPEVDDLYSFDGSHLVPESSERWAAAFVRDLDPAIDGCLHPQTVTRSLASNPPPQ